MKDFKPIISTPKKNKNTLNQKNVDIKGKSDFSRSTVASSNNEQGVPKKEKQVAPLTDMHLSKKNKGDPRLKATLTQKISPAVNVKLTTLKPFLNEVENMPKATINEIIDLVVTSYVNTRLTTRQQEAFKAIYDLQLNLLN